MQKIFAFVALLAISALAAAGPHGVERVLDDFSNPAAWQVSGSDDVRASLRASDGPRGKALCLDYDLRGTAGYASMRRTLPLMLPTNYAFDLDVRGAAPANTLQFKLIDASGDNVWWHQWKDYAPPADWRTLRVAADAIGFAWGPATDHALKRSAGFELAIAAGAGAGGGRGSVCFSRLGLLELPPASAPQEARARPDPNAEVEAAAKQAPRGFYPRAFTGEQGYWTLVGIDGGRDTGLLSEDGALEIGKGGFTIEPFLQEGGKLLTWADVAITHSLRDGYLPIPGVQWKHGDLSLRVTAFGTGTRGDARLIARYDVRNDGDRARDVTLVLAARPLQVDPPSQFLNAPGGVSPIHALAWQGGTLAVDGEPRARLLRAASMRGATTRAHGMIVQRLARGDFPPAQSVHDPDGYASGAALYRVHLQPHSGATFGVVVPLAGSRMPAIAADADAAAWLQREEDQVAAQWHGKLDRVVLKLPSSQQRLIDTLRSSLAWILISRDGPELRPGTRSYARSWIRDGAMMADALLRLGDTEAARDYALWYAPHQFTTGKVPCCIDARGADPTPENDSPGELLHLIAQVYRYTNDRAFLQASWPHVTATMAYLEKLQDGERHSAVRMFRGLLPASISHEGYSAKPQHSYWDDFWALRGQDDALSMARALGDREATREWTKQRDRFRDDLYASIRASVAAHRIDFIPGSAELGDFDPTSTTIALAPGGQQDNLRTRLPPSLLDGTFNRYWTESRARADGGTDWDAYTPYEWRNVGVFARLGWRGRIPPMLDFFFAGQRPAGWNQWAEVVGRDAREPRFIGDMPHAWVASDYLRSILDLLAFEDGVDQTMVLGAGVQEAWLEQGGVALHGLRTPWGALGYSLRRDGARVVWTIDADTALPPGGLVLAWPLPRPPGATTINGKPARWREGGLRIRTAPARVVVE
ncbi:MAG: discoidin domain-containing protein [Proteobacteria bacterium]|nr:discoidin domain-containing protein [Pseudomonadota bacterium]